MGSAWKVRWGARCWKELLIRMTTGHIQPEGGRPRTSFWDYISLLALEHLGSPLRKVRKCSWVEGHLEYPSGLADLGWAEHQMGGITPQLYHQTKQEITSLQNPGKCHQLPKSAGWYQRNQCNTIARINVANVHLCEPRIWNLTNAGWSGTERPG